MHQRTQFVSRVRLDAVKANLPLGILSVGIVGIELVEMYLPNQRWEIDRLGRYIPEQPEVIQEAIFMMRTEEPKGSDLSWHACLY